MAEGSLSNVSSRATHWQGNGNLYGPYIKGCSCIYDKLKLAVMRRYKVNKETYWQQFQQDCKKEKELYRKYADHLGDHFTGWVISYFFPLEELKVLEQFLAEVPEDL